MKTKAIAGALMAAASVAGSGNVDARSARTSDKPNIIVILVDDMGYSDLGCYGSEIETPNIDRLAQSGIRYRTFYNNARSSPTRASLMTGLYPHQAGVGALGRVPGYANYQGYANKDNVFIPEVLRPAGYFSVMTGKWHLGYHQGVTPITRGFDRSLNAPVGGFYFWNDNGHKKGDNKVTLYMNDRAVPFDSPLLPRQWYSTHLWVKAGLEYIDEAVGSGKPFFWYMAHNAAHFPLQAPAETIAKYRGKYMEGWETVRDRRRARQIEMGLFTPDEPLTPRNPKAPDWEGLATEEKERYDLQMAIYAAVIEELDKSVGRITEYLKEKGILDNTLILLMSDNGGNGEPGIEGRLVGSDPGAANSTVFLGAAWADVANTPFFLYKHHGHEGGCNTPLIASWPGGIDKHLQGSIDKRTVGHMVDIMATLEQVGGGNYSAVGKSKTGAKVPPMEGTSLVPSFSGRKVERSNPIIVEHEGNKMLRDGEWKIVQEYGEPLWNLYNMRVDPTEMNDLAASHPDKLKEMTAKYEKMAAHIGVEPGIEFKIGKWYTPVYEYPKH
ncbi:arylsulfatase [Bacteroidia bacterium]|nr:arylsulfatase [Bacteroidia bacterium]